MITATHTILYVEDADAVRAFFRDVLGFPSVDSGDGWLIFRSPPGELAAHPVAPGDHLAGHHELFLMCDDLAATMAELTARGVEFDGDPADRGWGKLVSMRVPGAGHIGLYEPHHPTAHDL